MFETSTATANPSWLGWRRGEKDETDESKGRKGSGMLNKAGALQEGRQQLKMLEKTGLCFLSPSNRCQQKEKKKTNPNYRRWPEDSLGRENEGFAKSHPAGPSSLPSYGHHSSALIPPRLVLPPVARVRGLGVFSPTHSTSCSLSPA